MTVNALGPVAVTNGISVFRRDHGFYHLNSNPIWCYGDTVMGPVGQAKCQDLARIEYCVSAA